MTAQRYTHPNALARMAEGLCPECGHAPDEHLFEAWSFFDAGICGLGGLLRRGVEERIAQYREDVSVAAGVSG